jgi:hypothetical protein
VRLLQPVGESPFCYTNPHAVLFLFIAWYLVTAAVISVTFALAAVQFAGTSPETLHIGQLAAWDAGWYFLALAGLSALLSLSFHYGHYSDRWRPIVALPFRDRWAWAFLLTTVVPGAPFYLVSLIRLAYKHGKARLRTPLAA